MSVIPQEHRDRMIRERDAALEQRTLALKAARQAKKDAEDATIGLRDLLGRAVKHITGDAAALDMRREITEVIYEQDPDGEAREIVADLRRRAETAERALADLEAQIAHDAYVNQGNGTK